MEPSREESTSGKPSNTDINLVPEVEVSTDFTIQNPGLIQSQFGTNQIPFDEAIASTGLHGNNPDRSHSTISTTTQSLKLSADEHVYGTLMLGHGGQSKYLGPTAGSDWLKDVR